MPMIRLTVPSGALTEEGRRTVRRDAVSERRKAGLVEDATRTVLKAAGLSPADALRVWVLVHEQPDGTWGAGGSVIRYADLVTLAKGQQEQTGQQADA